MIPPTKPLYAGYRFPPEVITSYAKRWSVEPLFAAMKHGWGLKDAWQQSRQVLSAG